MATSANESKFESPEHQAALRQVSNPARTALHPKPNAYVKTFNHWVRRIHLYSGLLLLPWVFLYGITGFLFNHPTYFSSSDTTFFDPSATRETALAQLPKPAETAARLLTKINQDASPPYELLPETAAYRNMLRATFTTENGQNMALAIDSQSLGGNLRVIGAQRGMHSDGKKEPAPFEQKKLALESPPKALLTEAAPKILANLGYDKPEKLKPEMPPLVFRVRSGEETWLATYNEETGALTGERIDDAPPAMPFRQFLLRMHLTHVYPNTFNIRWIYCVVVDVMSLTMLFWGVSGVIMWLQIKRTRVLGALVLLLALISVAAIGPLMYEAITGAGR